VIRTAVFATILAAAASPALAFGVSSAPAPKTSGDAAFFHMGAVERLAPAGVTEIPEFGRGREAKGQTVIYDLSKGKPADNLDLTKPRDNPFMLQPERKAAPAH
jgi:hypothetical protein